MRKFFKTKKNPLIFIVFTAVALLVVGGSYSAGFYYGQSQPRPVVIREVLNTTGEQSEAADFNIFWEAWDTLLKKHISGGEITPTKLIEGAVSGLAGSFDDPYTTYFNAEDSKKFNDDTKGNFGGVGMEIGKRDGNLTVIAPLKDTPAERAGLKSLDLILEINDTSTMNMDLDTAVKLIRGEVGTRVNLKIFREGWETSRDFEIVREIIQVPTLAWEFAGDRLAHIELYSFNLNLLNLFVDAVNEASAQGARGIILDLRNNPGGYLDVAVEMAGWFLPQGEVVVTEKFSSGLENVFRSRGNGELKNIPTVILINEGSASASEILAGALRDQLGIKIIGTKSFGKGTVQELVELHDGSALKITIANWLLPSGDAIEKNGLEPDYKVELPRDGAEQEDEDTLDPQLEKAIEVLEEQL